MRVAQFRFAKVDGAFHSSGSPCNGALAGNETSSLRSSSWWPTARCFVRSPAGSRRASRFTWFRSCHAVCFSADELPLRCGQRQSWLIDLAGWRRFISVQCQECLLVACPSIRGCSGNGDEQPLHIQPGHRRVASLRHVIRSRSAGVAALAVGSQRALLPPRHRTSRVLVRVRSASSIPAAVAVVAAVRSQLPASHWLGALTTHTGA